MSLTVIAIGCFIASAIAFIRYELGRMIEARNSAERHAFIGVRLDRRSLIRLKRFHLIAGWITLVVGLIALVAILVT